MDWGHGYFTQSGYSFGYYPETMPVRLQWAVTVQGHQARARDFRYLDAGCGQGLNLVLAAMLHPDSEFVGIDFMPRHIAHGRDLAARLGLTNVEFIEGDFAELARDPTALGTFDYAVCHGITTWISPAIRADLVRLLGRVLAPGGVFYNSYNTLPGWLSTQPLQQLVLLEQERQAPEAAFQAARQTMARLIEGAPALAKTLPSIKGRLDAVEGQDIAYLLQEYNNLHWQPVFVSQMIDVMAEAKLDYLGTSTLAEIHLAAVPADLRPLLEGEPSVKIREQLRDMAINQGFRRDIYVKGHLPYFSGMQDHAIRAQRFVANPHAARPGEGEPYKIKAGGVELHGVARFYNELLDRMSTSAPGLTIGELIDGARDDALKSAVVETVCMMVHGGWVLPQLPEPPAGVGRAIRGLVGAAAEGAPYRFLPLPRSATAVTLSDTDWLVLDLVLKGTPQAQLPDELLATLQRLNRVMLKNGAAIQSAQEMRELVSATVQDFVDRRLPFLENQGVLAD